MRAPRVKETTTTSGSIPVVLAGAVSGFQAVSSVSPAASFRVRLQMVDGTAWQDVDGVYVLSGTTFTIDRVHASSSSGAQLSLSGGVTSVYQDLSANEIADIALTYAFAGNSVSI